MYGWSNGEWSIAKQPKEALGCLLRWWPSGSTERSYIDRCVIIQFSRLNDTQHVVSNNWKAVLHKREGLYYTILTGQHNQCQVPTYTTTHLGSWSYIYNYPFEPLHYTVTSAKSTPTLQSLECSLDHICITTRSQSTPTLGIPMCHAKSKTVYLL